jgi:hypothetical protein
MGDQLYIDMELSVENLLLEQLAPADAIIEITAPPPRYAASLH